MTITTSNNRAFFIDDSVKLLRSTDILLIRHGLEYAKYTVEACKLEPSEC